MEPRFETVYHSSFLNCDMSTAICQSLPTADVSSTLDNIQREPPTRWPSLTIAIMPTLQVAALHDRLRALGITKLGARLTILTALAEPTLEALERHLVQHAPRHNIFVVTHSPSIVARGERNTQSPHVGTYHTGDEVIVRADGEVEGWLPLAAGKGWVLRDGVQLGLGELVVPLPPPTALDELAALPPLTVRAVDGLCNRLRVVLSYAQIARRHGRPLLVWWPLNAVCDGRFSEAFAPLAGVTFLDTFPESVRPAFSPASHDFHQTIKDEGEPSITTCFDMLQPNEAVRSRVQANVCELRAPPFDDGGFISLHIRRTDHWGSHLTDDDFARFIDAYPTHAAFLATDNKVTQQKFIDSAAHGHRVRACTRIVPDGSRLRQTSLTDAAVDIFTAAEADGPFMGCYSSSFSDTIHRLRRLAGKAANDLHELTDAQLQMGVTVHTRGGHREHSYDPGSVMDTRRVT